MPSDTFTPRLQLREQGTGNNDNTWGDLLNGTLQMIEDAIAARSAISVTGGSTTLTDDQARSMILNFSGTLSSTQTIEVANRSKMWLVRNATSGSFTLSMKTSSGSAVEIPQGGWCTVFCDGGDSIFVSPASDPSNGWKLSATSQISGYAGAVEAFRATALRTFSLLPFTVQHALTGATAYQFNCQAQSASFDTAQIIMNCARASSTAFYHWLCTNSNGSNISGYLRGDGAMAIDGSYTSGGADYAEYFEWADGNPDNEDRVGMSVYLVGNKVMPARGVVKSSAKIIGVVSANPTVIGDANQIAWSGKFIRDDFGRLVQEEYQLVSWVERWEEEQVERWDEQVAVQPTGDERQLIQMGRMSPKSEMATVQRSRIIRTPKVRQHNYAVDALPAGMIPPPDATYSVQIRPKLNPDFDPKVKYIPREDRKEWAPIGAVGKLRMRKGDPTNPRWRKLRDISPTVEEWWLN